MKLDPFANVHYDPDTGLITGCHVRVNCRTGYLEAEIGGKCHRVHRLAWYLTHGEWPPADMDHIDGDGSNNRLDNLRLATPCQNAQNRRFRGRYTTKCIYFDPSHSPPKQFRVRVQADHVRHHNG
jgi:hypothetical protein